MCGGAYKQTRKLKMPHQREGQSLRSLPLKAHSTCSHPPTACLPLACRYAEFAAQLFFFVWFGAMTAQLPTWWERVAWILLSHGSDWLLYLQVRGEHGVERVGFACLPACTACLYCLPSTIVRWLPVETCPAPPPIPTPTPPHTHHAHSHTHTHHMRTH